MSNGNGSGHQTAASSGAGAGVTGGQPGTETLLDRKLAERWRDTKNEAGRPEGRVVQALVLGEQRYPDPTVWGPKTKGSLLHDEDYRDALNFLSRLDRPHERD